MKKEETPRLTEEQIAEKLQQHGMDLDDKFVEDMQKDFCALMDKYGFKPAYSCFDVRITAINKTALKTHTVSVAEVRFGAGNESLDHYRKAHGELAEGHMSPLHKELDTALLSSPKWWEAMGEKADRTYVQVAEAEEQEERLPEHLQGLANMLRGALTGNDAEPKQN